MTDSAGARLRASILETYELDLGELVLLDQAVEVADALDRINVEVRQLVDLAAEGSAGQVVEHPMLRAQRQHSITLARLLEAMRLPAPGSSEDETGESPIALAARKAARARWDKAAANG